MRFLEFEAVSVFLQVHVSLEIFSGERWAVLGECGSFKSSRIQWMLGLQKPSSGHVRFESRDPTGLDAKIWRHLQAVFQDVNLPPT
jgi:oligopeptide transport system ATP-binding protein